MNQYLINYEIQLDFFFEIYYRFKLQLYNFSTSLNNYAKALLISGVVLAGFTGYQTVSGIIGVPNIMVVNGHSMMPALQMYDLLIMSNVQHDNISVGDIVAIDESDDEHLKNYTVHRVVELDQKDDQFLVKTKGDNSIISDGFSDSEMIVGKLVLSIPKIGFLLSPPISIILILLLLIMSVYSRRKIKD